MYGRVQRSRSKHVDKEYKTLLRSFGHKVELLTRYSIYNILVGKIHDIATRRGRRARL